MHFETLPSRTLMAATAGIDPTFGGAGGVQFSRDSGTTFGDAFVAIHGSMFAEVQSGSDFYVARYTDAGKLDTRWAHRGLLPVVGNVSRLAYDRFTGDLYIASTIDRALTIERATADGTPDTVFGSGGTFRYDPAGASDGNSQITLQGLVPLKGGRLLVAMRRDSLSHENRVDGATYQDRAEDVAMMRVRNNGTRDPAFGQFGITSLLGGGGQSISDDFGRTNDRGTLVDITDLQAEDDGTFDVAIARRVGNRDISITGAEQYRDATLTVKTRVLTRAGQLDDRYAFSWDIVDKAAGVTKPVGSFIGFDGDAVSVFDAEIGSKTTRNVRYNLVAGQRPRIDVLPIDSQPVSVIGRDADGYYYATFDYTPRRVEKLNSRLQPYRPFAVRGLATASTASMFVPDEDGRVLAISTFGLQRLI